MIIYFLIENSSLFHCEKSIQIYLYLTSESRSNIVNVESYMFNVERKNDNEIG